MSEWKTTPDSPGFWWAYTMNKREMPGLSPALIIVQDRPGLGLWVGGNVANAAAGFLVTAESTRRPIGGPDSPKGLFMKMSPQPPSVEDWAQLTDITTKGPE